LTQCIIISGENCNAGVMRQPAAVFTVRRPTACLRLH